ALQVRGSVGLDAVGEVAQQGGHVAVERMDQLEDGHVRRGRIAGGGEVIVLDGADVARELRVERLQAILERVEARLDLLRELNALRAGAGERGRRDEGRGEQRA